MIQIFISIFLAFLTHYVYTRINSKIQNLPPGPYGPPFIGNIHSFVRSIKGGFYNLSLKYGKIFRVQLGPINCVSLNDAHLIKEAFNDPNFNGRPDMKIFKFFTGKNIGIMVNEGVHWDEQRKFTTKHLRNFGFGKNSTMEILITEEVKELLELLGKKLGQGQSINNRFGLAVLNSIWIILTGTRFHQEDEKLSNIRNIFLEAFFGLTSKPSTYFLEWTLELVPELSGWNSFIKAVKAAKSFMKETVDDHRKSFNIDDTPRDFMDLYLAEIYTTTDPKSSFYGDFGHQSLEAVVNDIFFAGSETTATTLSWAVLYIMANQDVQKKLQKEIDKVVGRNRLPNLNDKPNMPYTEAVILEIHRKSSIASTGIFHRALKDGIFQGYKIPKDSIIVSNLWFVHQNPEIWGDPENFRPDRFLCEDLNERAKLTNNVIPFSLGKRTCPGDIVARIELFLFITAIFQKFDVTRDPENFEISLEPVEGLVLTPHDFKCVLNERI